MIYTQINQSEEILAKLIKGDLEAYVLIKPEELLALVPNGSFPLCRIDGYKLVAVPKDKE